MMQSTNQLFVLKSFEKMTIKLTSMTSFINPAFCKKNNEVHVLKITAV